METLSSLPFASLRASKTGVLSQPFAMPGGTTDLIIISHGWKNDESDARDLYDTLLTSVQRAAGPAFGEDGRRWAVAGVFWPAFRFQPDLTLLAEDGRAQDVAAASVDAAGQDLSREELAGLAGAIAVMLDVDEGDFTDGAVKAAHGGEEANIFVDRLRCLLTPAAELHADHADLLGQQSGSSLVNALRKGTDAALLFEKPERGEGGNAAGYKEVVATLRQWRRGGRAAVASVLNQATYYEMKARAGVVGAAIAPVIDQAVPASVRVHLIGHSFGARLVTSLANTLTTVRPASLSLLQGAFSHNGFGDKSSKHGGAAGVDGAFRRVVADQRISGPIMVTHTRNDTAVGLAYALASTLSQQVASGLADVAGRLIGGPEDRHGGLGANGALSLLSGEWADHVALPDAPTPRFASGKVHNVLADAIIADHNDVKNPEVARWVWAALA
ncbi:hypothetical protein HNO88_003084 [Novosphingobium chloroacetimidivorans]|uniref:Serine-threonine protein kinase n=1 Tax=Novosphingobium chloroacetimidivorans TaxID=1428314 RepID=A0A7W7KBG1_9SPHN|nr:hypothetical protein [Novosphingobium chloroacetimidivorans]MBB4859752.1 hypothetical protein [Novosphingobium chloroacetimidivorans]